MFLVGLLFPKLALVAGFGCFAVLPNQIHEAFAAVQPFEKVPRTSRCFWGGVN